MLSSSSPVTAATRSGGRAIPARSRTLISVASPLITTGPNSASSCSKRPRFCSISVTSWPRLEERARDVRTDLATSCDDDVHQTAARGAASHARTAFEHRRRRRLRRADRAQTALRRRSRRARDPARARRRRIGSQRRWITCAITRFELSPSVATTTAPASLMPASSRTSTSIPCPTMKPPCQAPRRASAVSSSSMQVTSHPSSASSSATSEPTRPQPTITAFMGSP